MGLEISEGTDSKSLVVLITTDDFHKNNHTTCSSAFRSSNYCSLKDINTMAAEQTNSVLRNITHSTTFMSPKLYMKALTLFMANLNILAKQKKQARKLQATLVQNYDPPTR